MPATQTATPTPDHDSSSLTFEELLPIEREQIRSARELRRLPGDLPTRKVEDSSIGLAFSGGGIRSATFNLGMLQALAEHDLLRKIDYLSTVSGGGYIGGWFAAFTNRYLQTVPQKTAGIPTTFKDVQDALVPRKFEPGKRTQPAFLFWLRQYSNYLTPNSGLITGDTWAMAGTWLRNVFLNQTIIGLFFVGALLLCHDTLMALVNSQHYLLEVTFGAIALFVAAAFMGLNVVEQVGCMKLLETPLQRIKISISVMFPFVVACVLLNAAMWRCEQVKGFSLLWCAGGGAAFYSVVWAFAIFVIKARNTWRVQTKIVAARIKQEQEAKEEEHPETKEQANSKTKEVPVPASAVVGSWFKEMVTLRFWSSPEPPHLVSRPALVIWGLVAGAAGAVLLKIYVEFLKVLPTNWPGMSWLVVTFGSGIVMLILLIAGAIHLGLIGRGARDLVREWWARLGGYLMLITMSWLLLAATSSLGPLLVLWLFVKLPGWISVSGIGLWIAHNYLGLRSANDQKTTGQTEKRTDTQSASITQRLQKAFTSRRVLDALAKAAPYVFAGGMLLITSTAVHIGTGLAVDYGATKALWHVTGNVNAVCDYPHASSSARTALLFCDQYWFLENANAWVGHKFFLGLEMLVAALALCGAGFLLSWRVDVNDFSLHHFYRNRLVRCYLGASNPWREPQPFTGFDPDDDIALKEFADNYPGPYPIINAALNITTGEELGYATRRAKSFVFTPLYCGYDLGAATEGLQQFLPRAEDVRSYCETRYGRCEKALGRMALRNGISLGTAMAISGAAAAPNMGYYTSPATAFFMTLFDVRLGWWIGNPRYEDQWKKPGPELGLGYLFSELLAKSDQKRSFVYLSDGGHFENLAAYELIKRQCKLIIVCDADCDQSYEFENLLSLIEKARTDFGARIEIDYSAIRPSQGVESTANFVKGKIFYDPAKGRIGNDEDQGILIYIKASLPMRKGVQLDGDATLRKLPDDVWHYHEKHPMFPHQSTADQWFDELQFESYRALGEYIGLSAAKEIERSISKVLRVEIGKEAAA